MIVFYGRHYMAYFYSERHDAWYQFDDENIKRVGNWADVTDRCVKGRTQPIVLFYEKQEIIVNFLTQEGQLDGQNLPGFTGVSKQLKDKMGDPIPINPKLVKMMHSFYKNVHKHPESFYFTEEGKTRTNFWESRPGNTMDVNMMQMKFY